MSVGCTWKHTLLETGLTSSADMQSIYTYVTQHLYFPAAVEHVVCSTAAGKYKCPALYIEYNDTSRFFRSSQRLSIGVFLSQMYLLRIVSCSFCSFT